MGIISLTCSSCGVRLKAADHMVGRHAPCPECGKPVLVTREGAGDAPDGGGRADRTSAAGRDAADDGPRTWATVAGVRVTTGRLVMLLVAAALVAVAVVGWRGI